MKRERRYYFLIEREQLNRSVAGVSGVLDMLLYDGAVVESNPPRGYYLLSSPSAPHVARWNRFGIKVAFVPSRATEYADEAIRWAECQRSANPVRVDRAP